MKEEKVIKKLEILSDSSASAELITSVSTVLTIDKNTILIEAGKKCNYGYIVLEGAFIMQYVNKKEVARTVSFHLSNHHPHMAPAEAFFMGAISEYQVRAIDNSVVLRFSFTDFEKLKSTNADFEKLYIKTLLDYLIKQDKMKTKLVMLTPEELYVDMVTNEPQIIKHFPSKYIAEYIGISREWLSKLRSK